MKSVYPVYKPIGKTPLDMVRRFKAYHPTFSHEKVSYAGRLDPMAEGLLLLLVGDENKNRSSYEKLRKNYTFSVLFGIGTDSYDILGIPLICKTPVIAENDLRTYIRSKQTTFKQQFPPFSSKTVHGTPLYKLARDKKIDINTLPKKDVTIFSFSLLKSWSITSEELLSTNEERINLISGDFRQIDILSTWRNVLSQKLTFHVYDFSLTCSSGTYVRGIADQMGKDFHTSAIAFSIKRTAIGNFKLP